MRKSIDCNVSRLYSDTIRVSKNILEKNGTAEDDEILMNLETAQRLLGGTEEVTLMELAVDPEKVSKEKLLEEISKALPEAKVTSLRKAMLERTEVVSRLARFGFSVSFVILPVGTAAAGIGLMSSVRMRTLEIGLIRAMGFRKAVIEKIIFLEGLFLSCLDGVVGFLLGSLLVSTVMPLATEESFPLSLSLELLVASILLSLIIGAAASIYPAKRAAELDPSDALRTI